MIVDAHVHIPTPECCDPGSFFREPGPALEYLRESGTDRALFTTWGGLRASTVEALDVANEKALALWREYGDFLYPAVALHPSFPEASVQWLARFRDLRLMWVGELLPQPGDGGAFDAPPYIRLFEECAKHGHVVQLHCGPQVREVAARFPSMQVVHSHIPDAAECRLLAALPNVWLDISGQRGGLIVGVLETVLSIFGPDRLLYGTDFHGYEPRCFMSRVDMAIASPGDREKVFHRNVTRLLAQVNSRPI